MVTPWGIDEDVINADLVITGDVIKANCGIFDDVITADGGIFIDVIKACWGVFHGMVHLKLLHNWCNNLRLTFVCVVI